MYTIKQSYKYFLMINQMNSFKIVEITDKPIDVASLIHKMKNPGAGALSIFLGKYKIFIRNYKG